MRFVKTFSVTILALLLLSGFAGLMVAPGSPVGEARADGEAVSNDRIGDRVVFQQDYSTMFQVPDNMWLGLDTSPYTPSNVTLSYDYAANAVEFAGTPGAVGKLYIGGLSPAVQSTVNMDVEISSDNQNSRFEINYGDLFMSIRIQSLAVPDGGARHCLITSYRNYDPDLTSVGINLTDPVYPRAASGEHTIRFNLSLSSDAIARQTTVSVDGIQVYQAPFTSASGKEYDINPFAAPFLIVNIAPSSASTEASIRFHALTQTVPAYEYVTPISDPRIQPYGLDGPHPLDTITDGIALLTGHGGRGTLWADVLYVNDDNIDYLRQLIADGWELGIHYSTGLANKNMEQAIQIMESEYQQITELFGQSPTSWCSLQGNDNVTHANYAWANLHMVQRNGYQGNSRQANVGNLDDANWPWWANASSAGMVYPTFTHETDPDPAISYSISYSKFEAWLDNYAAAGVSIVGYYEYWTLAQNTYHTQVTDLRAESGKSLSFTIDNIGGKSRLYVAAPFAETVRDSAGNEVPFKEVDGGIIMEVEAGEYQVMTMSAYRQDQVDRAISPLYAIIPVVLVLAVLIGSLSVMFGKVTMLTRGKRP